jgi:uncharacterized membrane protein YedE/YeeE
MENFTPISATIGGLIIGLSATILLLFNGRIAGISGILDIQPTAFKSTDSWRLTFLLGLLVGGVGMLIVLPGSFGIPTGRSTGAIVAAGLFVGFGTRLGSGCTSGHGVCGLSRFSTRSLSATCTFMAAGFMTTYVVNHLLGGL